MEFEKVRAIIAKQLDIDPETITPSSSLIDDLHADSLDIVELVIDMELCLGLRRGELLGLQWDDIDWEKNQIHIVHNRVVVNGKSVDKDPKTETSCRTVDVPVQLIQKLRQHKTKCLANRLRLGPAYMITNYVIVHPDGRPIYPEYVTQLFKKLQKK